MSSTTTTHELPVPVATVIRAFRALLEARFGERLVGLRLFGSYARGDADESSDIDVSVIVQHLTERERTEAIDLALDAWRVERSTGPLSPLVWSEAELEDRVRAELRIARDILAEGIPS